MSDTKDTSKHGIGARTLSVKRPTVEQGRVRQNFSHGRSKTVAVEIKRKRTSGA
jgi:translation initiation factor IF-2